MSKQSRRPNRQNRPRGNKVASATRQHQLEMSPSDIETEVAIAWRDFAASRGSFNPNTLRLPNAAEISSGLPFEFGFITGMPSDVREADLYSEFLSKVTDEGSISVQVQEALFLVRAMRLTFVATPGMPVLIGWIVERADTGEVLSAVDLNAFRNSSDYVYMPPITGRGGQISDGVLSDIGAATA